MSQSVRRPSLILLPGMGCDAEVFAGQIDALRARAEVAVSDAHTRFESLPEMAQALLAEHPGRHAWVAFSMGGMLAFELLRQAPQRVQALALLGSSARPDAPATVRLRRQACALYAAGRMDEVLRANTLFAFHRERGAGAVLIERYLTMLHRCGPEQLMRQNEAVIARPDSRPLLPQIACPTLVLCGDGDVLTPPELSREMAAAIPGARFEIVGHAGHMLTLEQPERVAALLCDWLGELSL